MQATLTHQYCAARCMPNAPGCLCALYAPPAQRCGGRSAAFGLQRCGSRAAAATHPRIHAAPVQARFCRPCSPRCQCATAINLRRQRTRRCTPPLAAPLCQNCVSGLQSQTPGQALLAHLPAAQPVPFSSACKSNSTEHTMPSIEGNQFDERDFRRGA